LIATDPLSLVFIFCFLVGFGFFLVTALIGSHGHSHVASHSAGHGMGHTHIQTAHHPAIHSHAHAQTHPAGQQAGQGRQNQASSQQARFSPFAYLNPTSLGLFLLGFGLFGYFFHNLTNLAASLSLFLAAVSGIVLAAVLLFALSRIFANSEGSTELDVADRTGMLGKVSITIPEKGLGEIIYISPGGLRKSIPARGLNNQRVERDQEVVVINYENGVAEVDTWEHFMHEETRSDPSVLDELARLRSLLNESSPGEMEMVVRQEQQKE